MFRVVHTFAHHTTVQFPGPSCVAYLIVFNDSFTSWDTQVSTYSGRLFHNCKDDAHVYAEHMNAVCK
jgi:hypothetical protein